MNRYAISLAKAVLRGQLAVDLHKPEMTTLPGGLVAETPQSVSARNVKLALLGKLVAGLRLSAIQGALKRLPDAAKLVEMGSGLDPLRWLYRAGGYAPDTDEFAIVVQCSSAAQRNAVESQLDGSGIAHRRAPLRPGGATGWWQTVGSAQFPGATEATWEILSAYAATLSPQLQRLIDGAADVAVVVARAERWVSQAQSVLSDVEVE